MGRVRVTALARFAEAQGRTRMTVLKDSDAGGGSSSDAQAYVQEHLHPVLAPALVALCRARPQEPREWLAQYLLENRLAAPEPRPPSALDKVVRVLSVETRRAEPYITAVVQRIASNFPGARLVDLDFKFKTAASVGLKFERFVGNYQKRRPELTRDETEAAVLGMHTFSPGRPPDPIIVDALRYTLLIPRHQYAAAVAAVRAELTGAACGFAQLDNKNFWHGEQLYRGINDVYAMPLTHADALARELFFEVQLHTPDSIELKHTIHPMMKQVQHPHTDEATRLKLQDEMLAKANACPIPSGALELPMKVVRPPWWGAK